MRRRRRSRAVAARRPPRRARRSSAALRAQALGRVNQHRAGADQCSPAAPRRAAGMSAGRPPRSPSTPDRENHDVGSAERVERRADLLPVIGGSRASMCVVSRPRQPAAREFLGRPLKSRRVAPGERHLARRRGAAAPARSPARSPTCPRAPGRGVPAERLPRLLTAPPRTARGACRGPSAARRPGRRARAGRKCVEFGVHRPQMVAAQPDVLAQVDAPAACDDHSSSSSRLGPQPGRGAGRSTASVQPSIGKDSGPPNRGTEALEHREVHGQPAERAGSSAAARCSWPWGARTGTGSARPGRRAGSTPRERRAGRSSGAIASGRPRSRRGLARQRAALNARTSAGRSTPAGNAARNLEHGGARESVPE